LFGLKGVLGDVRQYLASFRTIQPAPFFIAVPKNSGGNRTENDEIIFALVANPEFASTSSIQFQ
jgi:hypothetical protein